MIDQRLDLILVGSHMLLKSVLYLLDLTHLLLSIFPFEVVNALNLASSSCLLVCERQSVPGVTGLTLAVDFLRVIFKEPSLDLLPLVFQMRRLLHEQRRLHIPHDEAWVVKLKVFHFYDVFFVKVILRVHLPRLLD